MEDILKEAEEQEMLQKTSFNQTDFETLFRDFSSHLWPGRQPLVARYENFRFQLIKTRNAWVSEHEDKVSEDTRSEKRNEHLRKLTTLDKWIKTELVIRSGKYLSGEYVPSKKFLVPMTKNELKSLTSNLKEIDAKQWSSGMYTDECQLWQGCVHYGLPRFERHRRPEFDKKRVAGQTIELVYNFTECNLKPGEQLENTCGELTCVNIKHYKKVSKKKRKRKEL
jgi:hypothetical protein